MSGLLKGGRLKLIRSRLGGGTALSRASDAGPRRLAIIAVAGVAMAGLVAVVVTSGRHAGPLSRDARMKAVDALPGGLHSTPEQDALARQANTTQAQQALNHGASFTPPMAPSVAVVLPPPDPGDPGHPSAENEQPAFVGRPRPQPRAHQIAAPVAVPIFPAPFQPLHPPASTPAPQPAVIPVAAAGDAAAAPNPYTKPIGDLFGQWGGRAPETDVVLPPDPPHRAVADDPADGRAPSTHARGTTVTPAAARSISADPGEVLIPAGRGIYAHPVLAVNSDTASPVVLQADSGPIAGDRMIGTFSKQSDRLVIRINTVVHQGKNVSTEGLVIAPDTMETAVASEIDQHYVERFVLPAAAAFIQGLGQAIATTSNTTAVLSPLGGATTTTQLNFQQQLGVAAGAAAGQIGTALNQAAPKGPTIKLEANVAVGVIFLAPVTIHRGE